jgi:hypothetical protein
MNPYLFLALFIVVVVTGLLFGFYLLIDFVRAMNPIVFLLILLAIFIFFIYLVIDFASSNPNSFMDKWAKKTLWLWLPFYAFQRLIKEVILKK